MVERADGERFRVRAVPTDVHRWTPWGGGPNLILVILTSARRLLRGERSWTVTVTKSGFWREPPVIEEHYQTRREAIGRAQKLVSELLQ